MTGAGRARLLGAAAALAAAACGARPAPAPAVPDTTDTAAGPDAGAPTGPGRPLEPGAAAPEFALPDASGRTWTLSELRAPGPVVVVFYQGAWCGTCRVQLRRFQAKHAAFRAAGAGVVAISRDRAEKSRRLAENLQLAFPLLTDEALAATAGFGVTQPTGGLSLAAVFVVDRDGLITWAQVGEEIPEDQVLDAVRALAPAAPAEPTP